MGRTDRDEIKISPLIGLPTMPMKWGRCEGVGRVVREIHNLRLRGVHAKYFREGPRTHIIGDALRCAGPRNTGVHSRTDVCVRRLQRSSGLVVEGVRLRCALSVAVYENGVG